MVAGTAFSTSSLPPTLGALSSTYRGGFSDGFALRLTAGGDDVVFATYIGGSDSDYLTALAVDPNDGVYVVGSSRSDDFPITPATALATTRNGGDDMVLVKMGPKAQRLEFGTYFGSSGPEVASGVALDDRGNIYVCGAVTGRIIPFPITTSAVINGESDAVVMKWSPTFHLLHSTFVGGSGWETGVDIVIGPEEVLTTEDGVELKLAGYPYVVGVTTSKDLPTTVTAIQSTYPVDPDALPFPGCDYEDPVGYVARLTSDFTSLLYCTYLSQEAAPWVDRSTCPEHPRTFEVRAAALDDDHALYVFGVASGPGLPVTPGGQPYTPHDPSVPARGDDDLDAYLVKLPWWEPEWLLATYVGGNGRDLPGDVAAYGTVGPIVVGQTLSSNFRVGSGAGASPRITVGADAYVRLYKAARP